MTWFDFITNYLWSILIWLFTDKIKHFVFVFAFLNRRYNFWTRLDIKGWLSTAAVPNSETEMFGLRMSTGRICANCRVLVIFTSFIWCTTSTTVIPGYSTLPPVSVSYLRPDVSDSSKDSNTVSVSSIYSSSKPILNEQPENASSFSITQTTAPATATKTSTSENPSAVFLRQFSRCLNTDGQLVISVQVLKLESANWNINSSTAAPLTCTLTLFAKEDKVLHLTHSRLSSQSGCSEQNYIALTDGGSSHSVKITDCMDNWNRFTSSNNTLKILFNVGEPRALSYMIVVVEAVETALETGRITDSMGKYNIIIYTLFFVWIKVKTVI